MNVVVYTRLNCGACVGTKQYLKTHSIPFTEINVEEAPEYAQMLVDEGWRGMPVVKVSYQDVVISSWSGINRTELDDLASVFKA